MHSTKEGKVITLHKNYTPKLEIIMVFPILELIASGSRMETFRAYTNPNGKDISSLKATIISEEGCSVEQGALSFKYDITQKGAILRLDRSKILPHEVKGYICIIVSGNYKFEQIVKLEWAIHKEVPKITADWLKIDKNKNTIVWKTGKVFVSELSLLLPSDIQNNLIWHQMPSLSITLRGNDSEKFTLEPIEPFGSSCISKYNLYFNCQDTIEVPAQKDITLLLLADSKEIGQKGMNIEFHPAKRFVTPELTICTTEYELGAQNTLLAKLKLSCKSDDITAIAKVKVSIKCNDKIIECDESEVKIMTSTSKTVNIKMIRENLTKLPINDITVEVVVESCNQYTEVSDFLGVFKLTI